MDLVDGFLVPLVGDIMDDIMAGAFVGAAVGAEVGTAVGEVVGGSVGGGSGTQHAALNIPLSFTLEPQRLFPMTVEHSTDAS